MVNAHILEGIKTNQKPLKPNMHGEKINTVNLVSNLPVIYPKAILVSKFIIHPIFCARINQVSI